MGEIKCVLYDPKQINWKARSKAFELMMSPDDAQEQPEPKKLGTWVPIAFAGISLALLGLTVSRIIS